ncbi:MAG: Ig domain-containing protein [Paludibacter sp.]|nr:Ig domain-containing protein [Paludibacter sp.]
MKLKHLFLAVAILPLLFSCDPEVTVTGIAVDKTSVTLTEVGQTDTLVATVVPAKATVNVTWKSSNTAVATVTGDGMTAVITAVGNGTAKISATTDIFSAECTVTVNIGTVDPGGEGSKSDPYSISYVIEKSTGNKDVIDQEGVWVKGIVVGYYNSDSKTIETADTDGFNIVIAATASEKDVTKAVCVQLPIGDVRAGLSIKDNASVIGKEILVHGDITTYNTMAGIKNTNGYWLIAEDKGVNPPEKGNFDVPVMTIAELSAMYTGTDVELDGSKKIVAVVTSDLVGGNSTSKKNLVVTSEGNTAGIAVRFSDKDNTYVLGDKIEILLTGKLTVYAKALQLSVASVNTAKIGTATITPREATVEELNTNFKAYEFCVVKTQGVITAESGKTSYGNSSTHQNNTLTNNNSSLVLFVAKYSTFIAEAIPANAVSVTGIMQVFNDTKQIVVRNLGDVQSLN